MITADTITDAQIRELQETQSPVTGNCAYLCSVALGKHSHPTVTKQEARALCAEILNRAARS